MNWTIKELDNACQYILGDMVFNASIKALGRVSTMHMAAEKAFLADRRDINCSILREALKELIEKGAMTPIDGVWPEKMKRDTPKYGED